MNEEHVVRGSVYGIVAGTISTIVIDIVALIILAVMGVSLASFFALIGQCLLTLIGADASDPVWQGVMLHYSIAILTGLVIGLLTQRFHKLEFSSYRKGILLSVIIAEVEGNALFYLMSVIMKIPQSSMVTIYELCFMLHLIWGACLGLIISYSQQHKPLSPAGRGAFI
ncbi:MAG: hypothetical protein NTY79_04690 [Chloroflexi bacterium]|nr:hypothetical protein [Chloroflexota bacterium]